MWVRKKLQLSGEAGQIICSVLPVHPWTPGAGKKEATGVYLSPENAIAWATAKLASAPASLDVTAILLTAPTLTAFIAELATMAAIFPLPAITQVYRRATAAAALPDSRMQIPVAASGLPAAAPLSVSSLRVAADAAASVASALPGGADIAAALLAFQAERAAMLDAARNELAALAGSPVSVDVVSSVGNVPGAIADMREDIPHGDHVFSLCIVLAGADLSAFRGMLSDDD